MVDAILPRHYDGLQQTRLIETSTFHLFSEKKIIHTFRGFAYTGAPESCLEVPQKPQRPTSLPIQPFVLQPPPGKQSSNALGSLINHYMSQKHGASKKSINLLDHLALSSLNNCSYIDLEVASCTDTCSTCTPTPVEPHVRPHWAPPSPLFFQTQLHLKYKSTMANEPNLLENSRGAKDNFLDQTNPSLKRCMTCQEKTSLKSFPDENLQGFLTEQVGSHQTPPTCLAPEPGMQEKHAHPHSSLSPVITSVTSLTSDTSIILSGAGQSNSDAVRQTLTNEELNTAATYIFGPKNLPCMILLTYLNIKS